MLFITSLGQGMTTTATRTDLLSPFTIASASVGNWLRIGCALEVTTNDDHLPVHHQHRRMPPRDDHLNNSRSTPKVVDAVVGRFSLAWPVHNISAKLGNCKHTLLANFVEELQREMIYLLEFWLIEAKSLNLECDQCSLLDERE